VNCIVILTDILFTQVVTVCTWQWFCTAV